MDLFKKFTRSPLLSSWRQQIKQKSIIPEGNIIKTALAVVIAIMTFLGCLAIGAVHCINQAAQNWESQLAQEATIQLKAREGQDIEKILQETAAAAQDFPSVQYTHILSEKETEDLLKPWFGTGLDFKNLPIPRLIIVHFYPNVVPDFEALEKKIVETTPGARFNNHQIWMQHMSHIANISNMIALVLLTLVLIALTLTIVFATRAALSTNAHIVEILHFIGTDSRFIAQQFDFHFFKTALRGAFYGGIAAFSLFFCVSLWSQYLFRTIEGKQMAALFGSFQFSWDTYGAIAVLILFVSFLTMVTSHVTILKQLQKIDCHDTDLF